MKNLYYTGKIRDIYHFDDLPHHLLVEHTDKQSGFNRYLCTIPGRGKILTDVSAWWFKLTQHIIPNHYVDHWDNKMLVRKCTQFPVEVVVRNYITGSTKTSLWENYQHSHEYCGINFPEGLRKNQKIELVITPSTKDEDDRPISEQEVVMMKLMTAEEWEYVREKALELFKFGRQIAKERGLILADTKFEFGRDCQTGQIMLTDELFTVDSSRFWKLASYQQRFDNDLEPERFDKDQVRNWIRDHADPYNDQELPEVPQQLIDTVQKSYQEFAQILLAPKD